MEYIYDIHTVFQIEYHFYLVMEEMFKQYLEHDFGPKPNDKRQSK